MKYPELKNNIEKGKPGKSWDFCQVMFPMVSRSFAVNVWKLPSKLYRQVLVSYLLCRSADTIEDDYDLKLLDETTENIISSLRVAFKIEE